MPWTPEYQQRKVAEDPLYERKRNLWNRYRLSWATYEKMLAEQDNMCALCVKPFGAATPCVDHDHKTGVVRGLLCRSCNALLGWFEASTDAIAAYLGGDQP